MKQRLHSKLKKYALLTSATIGAGAAAHGKIVYTDVNPDETVDNSAFNIDLNGDLTPDFAVGNINSSYNVNNTYFGSLYVVNYSFTYGAAKMYAGGGNSFATDGSGPAAFFASSLISSGASWQTGTNNLVVQQMYSLFGFTTSSFSTVSYASNSTNGNFANSVGKYAGLKMDFGGKSYYGWAYITHTSNKGRVTIRDFAYQDCPGVPIKAGESVAKYTSPAQFLTLTAPGGAQLSFDPASNESLVGNYKLILVKSSSAGSFTITDAKAVDDANSVMLSPTGSSQNYTFALGANDADGDPIVGGGSYTAFILSVPNGTSSNHEVLATMSNTVTLCAPTTSTISPSVCGSYLSPAGNTYSSTGTYTDTITNGVGCDSIITINLTVGTNTTASISATSCGPYTSPSGKTYTTTGVYTDTISNSSGCDSIITIDLTAPQLSGVRDVETELCKGDSAEISTTVTSGIFDLYEDFSGGLPSGWTITDQTSSGVNWAHTTLGPVNKYTQDSIMASVMTGGHFMVDSDGDGSAGAPTEETWLNMPVQNFSSNSTVILGFSQYMRFFTNATAMVKVSTDGVNYTDFVLNSQLTAHEYTSDPVSLDISSVAANQSTVYISFAYLADYDYYWMIDDVSISTEQVNVLWAPSTFLSSTNTNTTTAYPTTTTTYTAIVSNSAGCTDTLQHVVKVGEKPSITATSDSICTGVDNTVMFTAQGADEYVWEPFNSTTDTVIYPASLFTPSATPDTFAVYGYNEGCNTPDEALVTLSYGTPITVTPGANQTICDGESISLTASGAVTYVWDNGAGTGSSVNVSPSTNTTYTVIGNSSGCTDTATVNVNVNPSPSLMANGDTTLCEGESTTISASGATTYSWDNGAGSSSSANVTPTASTTYTVVGTTSGCNDTASVVVTVNPTPNVSAGEDTIICEGGTATLTASGAVSYSWDNGGGNMATATVSPVVNTTYEVVGTDANNCTNSDQVDVIISSNPSVPTITKNGSELSTDVAQTYQWYLDGTAISGATSQTYTYTQPGDYTVEVGNANGCTSTSQVFTVTEVGISELLNGGVDVYPNPSKGLFNLTIELNSLENVHARVRDLTGRVLLEEDFGKVNSLQIPLNLEGYANSMYLLELTIGDKRVIRRLTVE